MTIGLSCLVDPRSWDQLLLDSEASLRLVDTALSDLLSEPTVASTAIGEFARLAAPTDELFVNGETASGRRSAQSPPAGGLLSSRGDHFRSRIRGHAL